MSSTPEPGAAQGRRTAGTRVVKAPAPKRPAARVNVAMLKEAARLVDEAQAREVVLLELGSDVCILRLDREWRIDRSGCSAEGAF